MDSRRGRGVKGKSKGATQPKAMRLSQVSSPDKNGLRRRNPRGLGYQPDKNIAHVFCMPKFFRQRKFHQKNREVSIKEHSPTRRLLRGRKVNSKMGLH